MKLLFSLLFGLFAATAHAQYQNPAMCAAGEDFLYEIGDRTPSAGFAMTDDREACLAEAEGDLELIVYDFVLDCMGLWGETGNNVYMEAPNSFATVSQIPGHWSCTATQHVICCGQASYGM